MTYSPTPVSNEDMDATYSVPTVVVNRFVVSTTPTNFRVVFGETAPLGTTVNHRIAVSMTPLEAYELKNVLESLLKPFMNDIEQVIKSLQEVPENGENN